jgi:paired small multidrug resistance pump
MDWLFLFIAGLFEMTGVLMINQVHKQRNWKSVAGLIGSFSASFLFLALAMETLPMGTAYAVWTGIGAAGGAFLGMIFYGEPKTNLRIFFISLVLGAAIGLKFIS